MMAQKEQKFVEDNNNNICKLTVCAFCWTLICNCVMGGKCG